MVRTEVRYRGHVDRYGYQQSPFSPDEVDLTHLDVVHVVAGLEVFDRLVCFGLAAGYSQRKIARLLGCSAGKVSRTIDRLRDIFEQAGFDREFK